MTARFEQAWEAWNELPAVATSSWSGGALAALHFAGVAGRDRALPVEHLHGDAAGRDPRGGRRAVRRLQPRRPLHVVRRLRAEGRAAQAEGGDPRPHRRPHRVRVGEDRRLLRRERDLPDRGLRARARRLVERPQARQLRRRRRLLDVRDQDGLDRRGRRARLQAPRAARVRARLPQLRQADLRGPGPQLPHERVHRGAGPDPGRADAGDRRLEERDARTSSWTRSSRARSSSCPKGWSRGCTST